MQEEREKGEGEGRGRGERERGEPGHFLSSGSFGLCLPSEGVYSQSVLQTTINSLEQ